jgi:hypothetical protein
MTCRRREETDEWSQWVAEWEDERETSIGAWSRCPDGWRVPVSFAVPEELPGTQEFRWRWTLTASAAAPAWGRTYRESFTLPVFKADTGDSEPALSNMSQGGILVPSI